MFYKDNQIAQLQEFLPPQVPCICRKELEINPVADPITEWLKSRGGSHKPRCHLSLACVTVISYFDESYYCSIQYNNNRNNQSIIIYIFLRKLRKIFIQNL